MNKPTVESVFGFNAGVVWEALNQNGPSNIRNLVKTTSLSREEVNAALGWLGREDKLVMVQKGRAMVFLLRTEEAHLAVPEEMAAEPAPKAKSKPRKTKQSKTKKARKVKSPIKQTEKIEEFLLH